MKASCGTTGIGLNSAGLPPLDLPFAGRERQRHEVEGALDKLTNGVAHFLEITGEPGIGKTSALIDITNLAKSRGFRVLAGCLEPTALSHPMGMLVDALDSYLSIIGGKLLEAIPANERELLAKVFPSFPASAAMSSDYAREATQQTWARAVRRLIETLAAREPLVVAIDDFHKADRKTMDLVLRLMSAPPRAPVLIAFAYRYRQAAAGLRRAVESAQNLTRLPLGPLAEIEISGFTGAYTTPGQRQCLHRASGGNPSYLAALLDPATPSVPDLDDSDIGRPAPAISAAIATEFDGLSSTARLIASAAAVLGDDFDIPIVAQVADISEGMIYPAIDELAAQELIRPIPGTGRFAFRHLLVRHAIYHDTSPGWRLGAHARAARALDAAGAVARERAPHLSRVAAPGDPVALEVLAAAADAVEDEFPAIAVQWRRAALRLLPCAGISPGFRAGLLTDLGRAYGAAGRHEQGCDALREALRLLPATSAPQRAEALSTFAQLQRGLGAAGQARALLNAELGASPGPDAAQATLLALEMACTEFVEGDPAASREHAARALGTADRCDRPAVRIAVCGVLTVAGLSVTSASAAAIWLDDAVPLLDRLPDTEVAARPDAPVWVGWGELFTGRLHSAIAHFDRAIAAGHRSREWLVVYQALVGRVHALCTAGRLDPAATAAETAIDVASALRSGELLRTALALRCLVAVRAGDQDFVQRHRLHEVIAATGGWFAPVTMATLAEVRLASGDAFGHQDMISTAGGPALPAVCPWSRIGWYELLTRAALDAGRPDVADDWALRAEALTSQLAGTGREGLAMMARAQVLAVDDGPAAAATALASAESLAASGMALDAARARAIAGAALVACGDLGDAQAALAAARQTYEECGAGHLARQLAMTWRRLENRSPGERRPGTGIAALTFRQRQVAELVGEGLTNREIGARLYVTEKTVEMHLSQVFAKLGVANRVGVVREFHKAVRR